VTHRLLCRSLGQPLCSGRCAALPRSLSSPFCSPRRHSISTSAGGLRQGALPRTLYSAGSSALSCSFREALCRPLTESSCRPLTRFDRCALCRPLAAARACTPQQPVHRAFQQRKPKLLRGSVGGLVGGSAVSVVLPMSGVLVFAACQAAARGACTCLQASSPPQGLGY
jgi:hypothetical protein